jgi:hypothetical protein
VLYLSSKKCYGQAMEAGWPIATGIIEARADTSSPTASTQEERDEA